jgi:RHS repeat-associated protein
MEGGTAMKRFVLFMAVLVSTLQSAHPSYVGFDLVFRNDASYWVDYEYSGTRNGQWYAGLSTAINQRSNPIIEEWRGYGWGPLYESWDLHVRILNHWNHNIVLGEVDIEGSLTVDDLPDNFISVIAVRYNGNPLPDNKRPSNPCPLRGDPFNAINGNAQRDETDITVPAPGLPFVFGRSYNSVDGGGLDFGPGWRASTDWTLLIPSNSASLLRVRTGEGRVFSFMPTDNTWICRRDVSWQAQIDVSNNWILDTRDGRTMTFDSAGNWLWTQDSWTNRITGNRDESGRITNLTHSCGLSMQLAWTNDRIAFVEGPNALMRVEYTYNLSGRLTGVIWRASTGDTTSRSYVYDDGDSTNALMTSTVNALGQRLVYAYGRQQDGSLRCLGSAYDNGSLAANATWDALNQSTCVNYPIRTGVTNTETIKWDETGTRMVSVEQAGQTLSYSYDSTTLVPTALVWTTSNQTAVLSRTIDSFGREIASSLSYGNTTGPVRHTEWLADLDLPSAQIDPLGWRTQFAWSNGLPTSIQETNGYGGWLTTSLIYSQGMLAAVSDPLNRSNCYQRDGLGCLTRIVPPAGPAVAFSNDVLGRMVAMRLPGEDGTDRQWQFLRDGFGRITNAVDPDGLGAWFTLDALGHVTNIIDRAGRNTSIVYTLAGHPLSATRTVTDNGTNRCVTLNFDYDFQLNPTAVSDALGRTVEGYIRDGAERVTVVTNIEGRTATTTYGVLDLPLTQDRFDGSRLTYGYAPCSRLKSIAFPDHTNTFLLRANGLSAGMTDGSTLVTNTWVAPGWLTSQETRTGDWTGRVEYACDLSGSVTQTTASAIGLSVTRQMDGGGRETNRIQTCNGTQLVGAREYGSWNGLPTRVTTGPIQQTLGWDKLDRLTNLIWQVQGQTIREIHYSYDILGQVTQRVDQVAGVETTRSYSYDALDRLASEKHSDGFSASYDFDDAGRRTAKSTEQFDLSYTPGDGDRLAHWDVTRTNMGNLTVAGFTSKAPATNETYRFQEVRNELSSVAPTMDGTNFAATLPAEPLGTQTVVVSISDMAGNVGVATNRSVLTAYTTGSYSSDAAGCVTQIVYQGPLCQQAKVLSWDTEYRLTGVTTNGVTAESQVYDPYGRRISTTNADGTVTRYLNDGQHVLADLDATGGVLRTYFYGPNTDELFAMTVYTGVVAQTYYAIRDHQNTVWAWVDGNGASVESYDFDAWGRVLSVKNGAGQILTQSAIGNRFLFQGREYSWMTGIYYFRARWYDPVTGRWLSPDPIGINGGLNQFVFCSNNSINNIDPQGLWQATIGGGDIFGAIITFGYNSGQWNFGGFVGLGVGAFISIDAFPDECKPKGTIYAVRGEGEIGLGPHVTGSTQFGRTPCGTRDNSGSIGLGLPGTPLGVNLGTKGIHAPTVGFGGGAAIGNGAIGYF